MTNLRTQRNDAIDNEEDYRKKYVARRLFMKIAQKFSTQHNEGPSPVWCDDLRPTNVIVDTDLSIRGIIDWEFCYAAPTELTHCSPWWLLLTHPEDWKDGDMPNFMENNRPRHEMFIRILQEEENEMIQRGAISEGQRLSSPMIRSLENGHFWFCLAATSSFGFDDIYWKFIDPLYHGQMTSIADRISILSQQEQNEIEVLVQHKMSQAEDPGLDQHQTNHKMFIA